MDNNDMMCRIPLNATVKEVDGKMKVIQADWADMSAYDIAGYILKKVGITAVLGGGDNE